MPPAARSLRLARFPRTLALGGLGLTLLVCARSPRCMAAVIGDGTPAGCSEAALDAALGCGAPSGLSASSTCTSGGAITFNCGSLPIIITLANQKTLTANTSIDGGGVVTLSGGGVTRVLSTNAGVTVTLANLTISGGFSTRVGDDGAAVSNSGMLTVMRSAFSGNYASFGGAVFNSGTLTVTDSMFSGNMAVEGGAIDNARPGSAVVTNTTFSDNRTTDGGAVYNSGTAVVRYSTFTGNSANFGGAIFNSNTFTGTGDTFAGNHATDGGAISDSGITVAVTDSTFSGNSALDNGGAVENNSGDFTGTNCTFSGNSAGSGGAIASRNPVTGGTVTLTNTILAGSPSGGNCYISPGAAVADGGNNIDDGSTCGFTGIGCTTTSGSSFCATSPLLAPAGLADNGGPTQTIALDANSPAIDGGNESVCGAPPVNNLDQRGFARPGLGASSCSIGAYEYNSSAASCAGDCDGVGQVTVTDLLLMVNVALGDADVSRCEAGDANRDGAIAITELLAAVNNALMGCPTT